MEQAAYVPYLGKASIDGQLETESGINLGLVELFTFGFWNQAQKCLHERRSSWKRGTSMKAERNLDLSSQTRVVRNDPEVC